MRPSVALLIVALPIQPLEPRRPTTSPADGLKDSNEFIRANIGDLSGYFSNTPSSMIRQFSFRIHIKEETAARDILVGVEGRSTALAVLGPDGKVTSYFGSGFLVRSGNKPIAVTGVWPNMTISYQPEHGLVYEFYSKGDHEVPKFFFADIGGLVHALVKNAKSATVEADRLVVHSVPDGDLTIELDPVAARLQRFAIRRLELAEANVGISFELCNLSLGRSRLRTDLKLEDALRLIPSAKVIAYADKKALEELGDPFSVGADYVSNGALSCVIRGEEPSTRDSGVEPSARSKGAK